MSEERNYLELSDGEREALWSDLARELERYTRRVDTLPVAPNVDAATVREWLNRFDFETPLSPHDALQAAAEGLTRFQLHTAHRLYFGVFNPAPTTMGVAADALVAAFNPQLASWVSSPMGIELEQKLLRAFATRFGFAEAQVEGTFTHGGTEANHTAMLTALTHHFPEFSKSGARGLAGCPVWYVSRESHHSFLKMARACGLGSDSARVLPVDEKLRLDTRALEEQITRDRDEGHIPFFAVATAGTTSAGVVDDIAAIAAIAEREKLWLHLDAAWGGAAILLPECRPLFEGSSRADSITLDAHKWLSVPMGAGLFLTRHPGLLEQTFRVDVSYMYRPERSPEHIHHPYHESLSWSRRLIGLKLFLSLAVAGWEGYRATLRHQIAMGERLRERLRAEGWETVNDTPLPVVCFVDRSRPDGAAKPFVEALAREIAATGKAWITTTTLQRPEKQPVLRAGISSYRTTASDIDELVRLLGAARAYL